MIAQRQAVFESLLATIERYFDTLTGGDSDRAFLCLRTAAKARHRDVKPGILLGDSKNAGPVLLQPPPHPCQGQDMAARDVWA